MPVATSEKARRERIWSCVLVNQCATPGLGSLLCRRFIAGTGQLLLSFAGFVLVIGWMCQFFYRFYLKTAGRPAPEGLPGWMGKWGVILFAAAWLWSLLTSISLLRELRRASGGEPPSAGT